MPSWIAQSLVGREGRLRNGWWVAGFLALLAALLAPLIVVSENLGREVTLFEQALLIAVATAAIQALRRRSIFEVTGRPGRRWLTELAIGGALGAALMAAPALALTLGGWIDWRIGVASPSALWSGVLLMVGVATAEELLFRGVLFQRLIAGIGLWPAQIVVGGLFVLTHLNNPGMEGATRLWAGVNIFAASILFGLAYARTRSLALPIGLHFMANVAQGIVFGFGVSGSAEPSLLIPAPDAGLDWLTGGSFGLEASLPGLVAVLALVAVLLWGRPVRDAGEAVE
jgi:hypothetical protein